MQEEYYARSIKYMVYGNVLRGGTYPISVSSERIFQAIAIARYAHSIGADAIAHGSTGAGNDQVRFDMVFRTLIPEMEIITPTRDMGLTRNEEIAYLKAGGYEADFTKMKYSYNVGLWGTSICGGELLDSAKGLPEEAYLKPLTREGELRISLGFEKGQFRSIDGVRYEPVMRDIEALLESSQRNVTGTVHTRILPGRFEMTGAETDGDLVNNPLGAYGGRIYP